MSGHVFSYIQCWNLLCGGLRILAYRQICVSGYCRLTSVLWIMADTDGPYILLLDLLGYISPIILARVQGIYRQMAEELSIAFCVCRMGTY